MLQHGVASDASATLLAKHPTLEAVTLWPSGTAALTDAAIPSLAAIPNIKALTLELSVFSYAGDLNRLKELSDGDLAKLKADLPSVVTSPR